MKNIALISLMIYAVCHQVYAQDISINVLQTPASLTASSSGQIQVDICNNAPTPTTALPAYKIIATITVSTFVEITGTTGLPTGWSVCSSSTQSISISNGSDGGLMPDECRTFYINIKAGPTANSGSTMTGTLAFAGGADGTKCTSGGDPTTDDEEGNNISQSSVVITGALPVTLLRFEARREIASVLLSWATASETNSDHFEVQQSTDAKSWNIVGIVKSTGESTADRSYHFSHDTPAAGMNYYRLRMIDRDGTYAFSSVRKVTFDAESAARVYPNPASTLLSIETNNWNDVDKVELILLNGAILYTSGTIPRNQIDVKALPSGVYIVKLVKKDGTIEKLKTVIAR